MKIQSFVFLLCIIHSLCTAQNEHSIIRTGSKWKRQCRINNVTIAQETPRSLDVKWKDADNQANIAEIFHTDTSHYMGKKEKEAKSLSTFYSLARYYCCRLRHESVAIIEDFFDE